MNENSYALKLKKKQTKKQKHLNRSVEEKDSR